MVLAAIVFPFGADAQAGIASGLARGLLGVGAEGGFTALTILWILWPALALHQHQQDSGALTALRAGLARVRVADQYWPTFSLRRPPRGIDPSQSVAIWGSSLSSATLKLR